MRLWMHADGDHAVITDEQLLAYLASAGSLSSALEHGDVVLVSNSPSTAAGSRNVQGLRRAHKTLADYLREVDGR